jgi:hypothetical protein
MESVKKFWLSDSLQKIKASPKEGEERLALFSGQLGLPISNRDVCKEAFILAKPSAIIKAIAMPFHIIL